VHPSFEALYERLLRNFTGCHIPKGERAESLTVEVVLDPEEGELSSVVPVGIPKVSGLTKESNGLRRISFLKHPSGTVPTQ
jgi:hypothetical protein